MVHTLSLLCCLYRHANRRHRLNNGNVMIVNGQPGSMGTPSEYTEVRLRTGGLKVLGYMQLAVGLVSMGVGVGFYMNSTKYHLQSYVETAIISAGMWGGAIVLGMAAITLANAYKGQEVIPLRGVSIALNILGVVGCSFCSGKLYGFKDKIDGICVNTYYNELSQELSAWCSGYEAMMWVILVCLMVSFVVGIIAASYSGTCCCQPDVGGTVYLQQPPTSQMVVSNTTTLQQYPQAPPTYSPLGYYPPPPSGGDVQITGYYGNQITVNSTNIPYTLQSGNDRAGLIVP